MRAGGFLVEAVVAGLGDLPQNQSSTERAAATIAGSLEDLRAEPIIMEKLPG